MLESLVVLVSAAVSSFLSGLLGIGGALVLAPLLLYAPPLVGAAAIPVKIITGLTIVQGISGTAFGLIRHHGYGNVSVRALRVMGPAIAASSLVGAVVSREVADSALLAIFAALSFASALALLLPERAQTVPVDELRVNAPLGASIAAVLGFFNGMVGIGGVGFIIPALIHMLRLPARVAIGTSLGIGLFGALAGFVGKAATAQVDPPLAAIVFGAALLVSPLGAAVSIRTAPRALTTILSAVFVVVAARIAWSAVSGQ